MKLHFKAPWGLSLKWISLFTTLLLIGIASSPALYLKSGLISIPNILGGGLPILLLLGAGLFVIRGYTITPETLTIHRLFWTTRIPLIGIVKVEFKPKVMAQSLRTCGNGGLYSFTGWYWSKTLGHYRAYVTDLNRTVVLHLKTRCIVISPDEPAAFVETIETQLMTTPP